MEEFVSDWQQQNQYHIAISFSMFFCVELLSYFFQLREKVEDKSKMPAELREKKTRAIRRRLTVEQVCTSYMLVDSDVPILISLSLYFLFLQQNKRTVKQVKKASSFPSRKYALRVA